MVDQIKTTPTMIVRVYTGKRPVNIQVTNLYKLWPVNNGPEEHVWCSAIASQIAGLQTGELSAFEYFEYSLHIPICYMLQLDIQFLHQFVINNTYFPSELLPRLDNLTQQ